MSAQDWALVLPIVVLCTAFAAWLVLGDPMTWEVFAGGALVIAGVRLTQRSPSTR